MILDAAGDIAPSSVIRNSFPIINKTAMETVQFLFRGSRVRVVIKDNQPWWVNNDVCRLLDIANPRAAISRLDGDEKGDVDIVDTMGRAQRTNVVNECGLYALILSSRKPRAREFKRWLTHDVIPSIRKNGAYITAPTLEQVLDDPDTMIQLLQKLKEERRIRKEAGSCLK